MRITTKYVLREHLGPLAFALSALTSLLLLNYVAKQFGNLVGKGLPWTVIAEFFLLSVPFTIAMTLPMAVLVASLFAFSRMAADSEITAFKASGVSLHALMRPVLVAAAALTLFMVWFNDRVLPASNHRLSRLTADIARKKPTFALKEQIINEVSPGRLYLRAGHLASLSNQMREVQIYDVADPVKRRVIYADSGRLELSPDGADLLLTLFDGTMHELTLAEPARLQRNFFRTDLVRVKGIGNALERDTLETFKSDREMTVCELEAKVSGSARTRDSLWRVMQRMPLGIKRPRRPAPPPRGLGWAYCKALDAITIRPAHAATTQDMAPGRPPSDTVGVLVPPSSGLEEPAYAEAVKAQLEVATREINQYQVEIEKKFAIAFACIVFVLLGAPVALRFPRGGVGMTIGVSLAVFGLYYVGLMAGESLADDLVLTPFWAMWAANALLGTVGLALTLRLGREGSTARGSEASDALGRLWERLRRRRVG